MSNEIIPYPPITQADKEGIPNFRVPEGINEKALRMLGCDCGLGHDFVDVRTVCVGGRNKGKMRAMKEFIKFLTDDNRKDVVFVRASDPIPRLKGNRLATLRLLPIELYDNETKD